MKKAYKNFGFSYGQVTVCDKSVGLDGLAWKPAHVEQGYSRGTYAVSFCTLIQFGLADLSVFIGPYNANSRYERVISVPFQVYSGAVDVFSPDDFETVSDLNLDIGQYRLTCAQYISSSPEAVADDEGEEVIDFYFEFLDLPLEKSEIIVRDAALSLSDNLLETVDVVGEL